MLNSGMENIDQKKFRSIENSSNGEVSGETQFEYRQEGDIVWATYQGGSIRFGTITGLMLPNHQLNFTYQHVNLQGEFMSGKCLSTPQVLTDGRIRYHEQWQWTCKDYSQGESWIEEVN